MVGTKYDLIYSVFFSKISDYDLANLQEPDIEIMLLGYLNTAISRFDECRKDLSKKNDVDKYFEETLSFEEIEILADHMVCCWIEPKLNDLDLLRNTLNTTDFSFFSPANLLKNVSDRYTNAMHDARKLTNEYSFKNKKFTELIHK